MIRSRFGYETGGKAIKLIGSNLVSSRSLACYFDEIRADCQWKSEDEIASVMPKLKPGNYTIKVSPNGMDEIYTSLQYQVRLQMTTVFARPPIASITGGATIQVFECTTPWHEVSRVVKLGIGSSETKDISIVENGFEYLNPFELSSILYPSCNGSIKGGTVVSVDGLGFAQARDPVYCNFGSSAVIASIFSDIELTCIL
eukprot:scaffold47039_cov62-Cyclotella_meneghiniana.AAC.7